MIVQDKIYKFYAPYWNNSNYPQGCFFEYRQNKEEVGHASTCRETTTKYLGFETFFGFYCNGMKIEKINEFFEIIEDKLGLEEKIKFYKTDHSKTIIIEVPKFWKESVTCRAFFTLFLRAASFYLNGNKFEDCFKKYELASRIPYAIQKFLDGYVFNINDSNNQVFADHILVTYFSPKTKEETDKILFKKLVPKTTLQKIWEVFTF